MAEVYRPVIKPVLLVNLGVYAVLVGLAALLLPALGLPPFLSYPLLGVAALLVGVLVALRTALAYWRHVTESYLVDADALVIRRGWAVRTEGRVLLGNVAEATAVVPLGLRPFGVGSVVVSTNDGYVHVLRNVEGPNGLAEKIRPAYGGPVFSRPGAG
jgi:membrane protein YdbS with pleckstrin-like domain